MFNKTLLLLAFSITGYAQQTTPVSYFALEKVQLTSSPFYNAMQTDKNYLLQMDADRLLAPYLKEAGLTPKADNYPNWENTGLDGHVGGHYISALALMYASTGDAEILKKLDYMINELERCQKANGNGYISGVPDGKKIWNEIQQGNIREGVFGLNDRWVPLYNIHKTFSGLRDAYLYAHNAKGKNMLIQLTDWMINITANLSDAQIQQMLTSEHGGLNEVFADVYAITGDKKYLDLGKKFSHRIILDPLLKHEDKLTGIHANTQIPKVIGFKRIADLEHNKQWSDAADFFWHNVTEKRSVAIGGNSISEHFNPVDDFSNMVKSVEGPETCNTYNMLKLTKDLYGTLPQASYMDYYERALYNHILSSQHSDKGGFVYFTPMRPGHYRVYSQPQTSFWCCVGSGMENHAKYGEMIYAHTGNDLYVNLFIPSKLTWDEKKVVVLQENNFPQEQDTKITINPAKKTVFALKLRCPEWTDKVAVKVLVNGKEVANTADAAGYITINRKWKKGDVVLLRLPMHLDAEQMPDKSDYYAFTYGPVVLAAGFGTNNQDGLFADDSRGGHVAHGPQIPLNTMPVLLGDKTSVLGHVSAFADAPLNFKVSGLYPKEQYASGFTLKPFYEIEGERYIIYWPQADADKVVAMQQQKAKEEEKERRLTNITVDKITLGEQQPEADHFVETKDAYIGYMEDRHFRDARGWFSYKIRNTGKNAKYLYVSYFDVDRNRTLNVEINGKKVTSQVTDGKNGTSPQFLLLPIPDSEKSKESLTVKFSAATNTITSKIIEVRLLSESYRK
ncbi:MAG: beta-L-arabinofuranosidase domain-containing protein [Bacteroidia bacterium]